MLRQVIKENIRYRKQTLMLSKVDLVKYYKGTALGYLWALIKPMVTIGVYLFAFQVGIRKGAPMDGFPFFLWLIAGLVPWFFISEAIIAGTMSIRSYKQFVTKMKFPVITIPSFVLLSKIYVQVGLIIPVIGIFIVYGYNPDVYYLQLLYYVPTMLLFFIVLSWSFGSIAVISRDFENLVKSSLQALLWITPILWNLNDVSSPKLRFILKLNPLNYFIEGYRDIFLYKRWFFETTYTIYIWIVIAILAVIGSIIYKKIYKEFADVL
ncbi:ABC transporter permease [Romboutsia sp.]|uniref:ABC transporter permease n=1 Tax=Romboutsia sp. TaxID=1965302 RepID=UPI003F32ABC9